MVSAIVSEARTPRLDSLTSLRWWAALAVFFFHVQNLVPQEASAQVDEAERPSIAEPEKK